MSQYMRKNLEESLRKRGWMRTTTGETVNPPERMFKTIPEEVMHLLNQSMFALNIKDIANYLGMNPKSVSKAMSKLMLYPSAPEYIIKEKSGRLTLYNCTIPSGVDIKTAYKMIRYSSGRKRKILENKQSETNSNIPMGEILDLVKSGELELVIRKAK